MIAPIAIFPLLLIASSISNIRSNGDRLTFGRRCTCFNSACCSRPCCYDYGSPTLSLRPFHLLCLQVSVSMTRASRATNVLLHRRLCSGVSMGLSSISEKSGCLSRTTSLSGQVVSVSISNRQSYVCPPCCLCALPFLIWLLFVASTSRKYSD